MIIIPRKRAAHEQKQMLNQVQTQMAHQCQHSTLIILPIIETNYLVNKYNSRANTTLQ